MRNAESGMRNPEGAVRSAECDAAISSSNLSLFEILSLTFRIPHSAFRTPHSAFERRGRRCQAPPPRLTPVDPHDSWSAGQSAKKMAFTPCEDENIAVLSC